MSDFKRYFVPGGTYFFTVVTLHRSSLFLNPAAVALLGSTLRRCQLRWPMSVDAIVLLPDHWHTIWSLPSGDSEYLKRIGWIKKEFTKHWLLMGNQEHQTSPGSRRQRRRGIWQPRYWEHTIEDEQGFQNHFDYLHWNPVKHGYVRCPSDWPNSSFHRWVRQGVYPSHWGCYTAGLDPLPINPKAIFDAGEPA